MKKYLISIFLALSLTVTAYAQNLHFDHSLSPAFDFGQDISQPFDFGNGPGISLYSSSTGFSYALYNFYTDFPSLTDKVSGQALAVSLVATRYGYAGGVFGENVPVIESGKLLTNGVYTQLIKKSEDISDAVWNLSGSPIITGTDGFQATVQSDAVRQYVATIDSVYYTINFIASVEAGGQSTGYKIQTYNSESGHYPKNIVLSTTPAEFEATVLGKLGGGDVRFGFIDSNSSNWAKVTITDFQVAAAPYRLPYVPNDTAGTISVPLNYSDADEGIKAVGIAANFPQLLDALDGVADGVELLTGSWELQIGWSESDDVFTFDATASTFSSIKNSIVLSSGSKGEISFRVLSNSAGEGLRLVAGAFAEVTFADGNALIAGKTYTIREVAVQTDGEFALRTRSLSSTGSLVIDSVSVKEISAAQGRITIPWTPRFNAADVSGVVHILTANDDATSFLFYNGATQEIHAFDGTNTAVVTCTPVNGTEYQISLNYGDGNGQKMWLTVDTTVGLQVTHAGSFPVTADDLSIAWEEEAPQEIGEIIFHKEPILMEPPASPPFGFSWVTDTEGNYIIDASGIFIITPTH